MEEEKSSQHSEIVTRIAETLGETDPTPLKTIDRAVELLGEEKSLALLEETLKVEAEGGLTTDDGTRQRTRGGIFFKLIKDKLTSKERWRIFGATPKPKAEPPAWDVLEEIVGALVSAGTTGAATKVKLSMMGTPGKVVEKGNVVLTSIQSPKSPNLPKALPRPPAKPTTTYLVFMAARQWQSIKHSIAAHPDDKLIVEGYPVFDKRIGKGGAFTVYAQNVTTVYMQQNRRDKRRPAGRGPSPRRPR